VSNDCHSPFIPSTPLHYAQDCRFRLRFATLNTNGYRVCISLLGQHRTYGSTAMSIGRSLRKLLQEKRFITSFGGLQLAEALNICCVP
jgi:hypothetical protein